MAPKTGDKAAWAPRIKKGAAGLTASVMKGMGAMPPKGGAASEADVKAAVDYMISQAKWRQSRGLYRVHPAFRCGSPRPLEEVACRV
jgi:hypothetical protein